MLQKGITMSRALNVPISDSVCPKIDFPKAHSFYGYCCPKSPIASWQEKLPTGYKFYIRISEYTLNNTEKSLMNTILHELLHTCPGCMNHQKTWQYWASRVNDEYGYNIKRCDGDSTAADKANLNLVKAPKTKIIKMQCECCGRVWIRHRESRLTLHPEIYNCHCGGSIKRVA